MAQRVNIMLVDDIDGTEADETVSFGLDGTHYEIDLNTQNAASLRDALASFVGHGRKVSAGSSGRRTARRATQTNLGPSTRELRDWGRSNGFEVSDRGRVSAEVRDAYQAAH